MVEAATDEQGVLNVSFYRFVRVDDPAALAEDVRRICQSHALAGKVVVAEEGINGMLAGAVDDVHAFERWIQSDERFATMRLKPSFSDAVPYPRLKVRVKPEIVTMGVEDVDVTEATARHLPPEQFRDWLRGGRDVVVVDVRNEYEIGVGTFRGAIDPETEYFNQFPDWVESRRGVLESSSDVVMFCTGGIRCEKATAWMVSQGFDNLWQLEGGVHNYFERIEDAEKDWVGDLFVFDRRVAVSPALRETNARICDSCGDPVVGGPSAECDCGG